jgi:hypothetical protein
MGYGGFKRRSAAMRKFNDSEYRTWLSLSHEGMRFPTHPECYFCGERMTATEVIEYRKLDAWADPAGERAVSTWVREASASPMTEADRSEAKWQYQEALSQT